VITAFVVVIIIIFHHRQTQMSRSLLKVQKFLETTFVFGVVEDDDDLDDDDLGGDDDGTLCYLRSFIASQDVDKEGEVETSMGWTTTDNDASTNS
jgi:hypothetical protein